GLNGTLGAGEELTPGFDPVGRFVGAHHSVLEHKRGAGGHRPLDGVEETLAVFGVDQRRPIVERSAEGSRLEPIEPFECRIPPDAAIGDVPGPIADPDEAGDAGGEAGAHRGEVGSVWVWFEPGTAGVVEEVASKGLRVANPQPSTDRRPGSRCETRSSRTPIRRSSPFATRAKH